MQTDLRRTIGYYAAFFGLGIILASLGPSLPFFADNIGISLRAASSFITGRSFGYLLGSLLGGRLYDRLAGNQLLAGTLLLTAAALLVLPAVGSQWVLVGMLVLVGIGQGFIDVGGNILLVWTHGERVGPFMNGMYFFAGVGSFLAPLIVAQSVLRSGSIRAGYAVLAALLLPAAVWLLRQPSPPRPVVDEQTVSAPINYRLLIIFAIFFFLYVGAEVSFGGWLFAYVQALPAPETTAGFLTSLFWGAVTVGRLAIIPFVTRLRPMLIVSGCLWAILAGLLLVGLGKQGSIWLVGGGVFVVGAAMAPIFPTTLAMAERRMVLTGTVTGLLFSSASAGGMFLPWIIGRYFESAGSQSLVVILTVSTICALAVLWLLRMRPQT